MPLACHVQWSRVSRSHRWHSQTKSGAWPAQHSDLRQLIEACLLTTRSKMFRKHLKCSLTAPRRAGTSSGFFFVSFYSASCLTLGVLVQRCLGQPVDLLAPWPSAAVIPRQLSTAVHFQSVERRVQRNLLEGLANVRLDELTVVRRHWLFFFVMLTRRRRGLGERANKILRRRHSNCIHYDACRRETAWVFPETLRSASRKTERPFQAQSVSHRADKTSLESKRTPPGFSQTSIFIPSPFSGRTNGTQWRQGKSKFLPCFS